MNSIATIILAAGESRRLGRPKQLLRIGETTLLQLAIDNACDAELGPVFVILGANASRISEEIDRCDCEMVFNENWAEGMQTSIRCGIERVELHAPNSAAAILMSCDQPRIDAAALWKLASAFHSTGATAVASHYADTLGIPALFARKVFAKLKALKDGGAKKLLKELGAATAACDVPQGAMDIDTIVDYARLIQSFPAEFSNKAHA